MRTEQAMFEVILAFAHQDARVRAAYLNGSRANPSVKPDRFQDFDVVFSVTETASFLADGGWIKAFGEPAVIQEPDGNGFFDDENNPPDRSKAYTWLILFRDGNRMDLHIETLAETLCQYGRDSLTLPLLDKDGILPEIPLASDRDYWVKKPGEALYHASCNEFWWCLNNVAKGLVRGQLPYAWRMYHQIVHFELERMVDWHIGLAHSFAVNTGMWGKYYQQLLSPALYAEYLKTYAVADCAQFWAAIFTACGLFSRLARTVGKGLGYAYNHADEDGSVAYLKTMQNLAENPE